MDDEWKMLGVGYVSMPAGDVPYEMMVNCSGSGPLFGLRRGIDHPEGGSVELERIHDPIYRDHLARCNCLWVLTAIDEARERHVAVTADYLLKYQAGAAPGIGRGPDRA